MFWQKEKPLASPDPLLWTGEQLQAGEIPRHIAIVMDGNGRWAKERGLPRIMGHKEGVNTLREVIRAASDLGVEVLTVFAFSSENWKRPVEEVGFLMNLVIETLKTDFLEMMRNHLVLRTSGDLAGLPQATRDAILAAQAEMSQNQGMILNVAINYGGRWELLEACRALAAQAGAGELNPAEIDEARFREALTTSDLPDPDLFIRTSGEERLSNFLLWQLAYSELYFTDVMWPDFTVAQFYRAIGNYQMRQRRYGGLSSEKGLKG